MNERGAKRVLVIDDDELSRGVLELLLAGEGYGVELAGSGEEALDWLREPGTRPDVILMDMQMPGLSGEELVRRLRTAVPEQTRVIAMSGSRPDEGETAEADGFLSKPFSMAEFAGALEGSEEQGMERAPDGFAEGDEVLDEKIFESFRAMLGEKSLGELYRACLRDAAAQCGRMEAAHLGGDYEVLRKIAHALKGSLGMLGARELEEMCLNLEAGVVNDTYVLQLDRFPDAIQRLRDMLNALGVSV